ncbi:hypothetical protein PaeBR_15980 [Paenibacillus sp. BR2-3]|uniref:hypothetical protein n=1 Tax=Paenibacillus sp. BR2-3 TaxID=3048494 RepID=UPI003977949C
MIYALLTVVLLLLLAGGVLAYKNSKLIANRSESGSSSRGASLMYSVYHLPISGNAKESGAVPLFQLTVPAGMNGSTATDNVRPATTLTLYRVAEGKGEMRLTDAENWMLNSIRQSAFGGAPIEHEAFIDKTINSKEKELIINLEEAAKGEAYRANHH